MGEEEAEGLLLQRCSIEQELELTKESFCRTEQEKIEIEKSLTTQLQSIEKDLHVKERAVRNMHAELNLKHKELQNILDDKMNLSNTVLKLQAELKTVNDVFESKE